MRQVDGWWSHSLGHKGHIAPGGAAHGMQDGLRSSIYHIQPTTRKIFILPVPKFSWFFPTVQNGWNQRRNLHRPTWPSIDRWARVSRYESPPPLDVIQYQEGDPIWGDIPQSHQLGELLLYLKSKLGWWELLWQCAALSFSLGSPQKRGARPAILCPWSHRSGQNRVRVPSPISEVMATEKKNLNLIWHSNGKVCPWPKRIHFLKPKPSHPQCPAKRFKIWNSEAPSSRGRRTLPQATRQSPPCASLRPLQRNHDIYSYLH